MSSLPEGSGAQMSSLPSAPPISMSGFAEVASQIGNSSDTSLPGQLVGTPLTGSLDPHAESNAADLAEMKDQQQRSARLSLYEEQDFEVSDEVSQCIPITSFSTP